MVIFSGSASRAAWFSSSGRGGEAGHRGERSESLVLRERGARLIGLPPVGEPGDAGELIFASHGVAGPPALQDQYDVGQPHRG